MLSLSLFAAMLAAPAAAADRDYDFSVYLYTPLAIDDIRALRREAEIATQDDSLLGEIVVFCGGTPGCWADVERIGEMDAVTTVYTRDDLLILEVTADDIIGRIEIAHGTPDPL